MTKNKETKPTKIIVTVYIIYIIYLAIMYICIFTDGASIKKVINKLKNKLFSRNKYSDFDSEEEAKQYFENNIKVCEKSISNIENKIIKYMNKMDKYQKKIEQLKFDSNQYEG